MKEKNSQILEKNSPNFRNHKKILKKASADNIFSNEEYWKKIAAKKLLQSPPFRFSCCYERMHYWLLSNFLRGDFGHLRRLNLQYKPFQSIPSLIHISMLQFMSWSYKKFKIKNSAKLLSCNPPCTNFLSRLWLQETYDHVTSMHWKVGRSSKYVLSFKFWVWVFLCGIVLSAA